MARAPVLTSEEARRRAEDRFRRTQRRDADALTAHDERAKVQQAEAAKTQRLRALRLAKEAADAELARRAAESKALATDAGRKKAARVPARKAKSEPV